MIAPVKISNPNPSGIFPRERIFSELDNARKSQIIWVSAPAGAGKTSLISSYLKARNLSSLWYHVDESDTDIASFFYYMGLAAKKAAPRYKTPLPLLTPEYLPGIKTFALRYFEQLYSRLISKKPHQFTIVFDNYQDMPVNSGLHEIISNALEMLPDGMTVIIITRNEPSAQFSRLLANNKIHHIGWDEIKFDMDETKKFIQNKDDNISDTDTALLYELTGGWAAGLVLMRNKGNTVLAENIDTREDIFNYFANEILKKTDQETREFLRKTAFLPDITVDIAVKLTGIAHARDILFRLNKNNYFIQQYVNKVSAYRYHPLFKDFVLSYTRDYFTKEELMLLQQETALLIADAGDMEGALQLFIDSVDWENAIKIILAHAQSLMEQGRSQTISSWFDKIPNEIIDNNPWLLYWLGISRLGHDPLKAREYLTKAYYSFKTSKDVNGIFLSWAKIVGTFLFEWGDSKLQKYWIAEFDEINKDFYQLLPAELEAPVAASLINLLMMIQPGHPALSRWAEKAYQMILSHHDNQIKLLLGVNLILYYLWMGDFSKAHLVVDILQPVTKNKNNDPLALQSWYGMEAMYSFLTADKENCQKIVEKGLESSKKSGIQLTDTYLMGQMVYAGISMDDPQTAVFYLEQMSKVNSTSLMDKTFYHYQAASVAWYFGDYTRSIEHGKLSVQWAHDYGFPLVESLSLNELAVSFFDNNQYDEAYIVLNKAEGLAKTTGMRFYLKINESRFAFELGDEQKGVEHLREGFAIGKEKGYVNIPRWSNMVMSNLCAKALEYDIEPEYAAFLIKKRGLIPQKPTENWPYPVRIFTFGGFRVSKDNKPVEFTTSNGKSQQKPLELLKAIIAMGSRNVLSEKISDTLWPDMEGDAAYNALTTTLQRLRSLLGSPKTVLLQDGKISLNPACVWVDTLALDELLSGSDKAEKEGELNKYEILCQKILALYKGDFLMNEKGYPWAVSITEKYKMVYNSIVEGYGNYLEKNGEIEKAIKHYNSAILVDDSAEISYKHLMLLYEKNGRPVDAVKIYQRYETILSNTIGIRPSPEMRSLYDTMIKTVSM